jgi:predicted alpha/beta hydrolase family esterase
MTAAILLVHGGNLRAQIWNPLLPLLNAPATALTMPGRDGVAPARPSLDDHVEALAAAFDACGSTNVMLVAHSVFTVAALAALGHPSAWRVRRLVVIAGVLPADGCSAASTVPSRIAPWINWSVRRSGSFRLPGLLARLLVANDMTPGQAAQLRAALVPEPLGDPARSLWFAPVAHPSEPQRFRPVYIVCRNDRGVPPERQTRMAANLAHMETVELQAGHAPMISRPAELAALLNGLCPG